jgi:hypothetical protein
MIFYSYLWLRKDGTPYYAGKGNGRRAFRQHERIHPPKDRSRILVFPMASEAEAFESEIALIDLFGRKDLGTGCLRNLTNGGDGSTGHRTSPARKEQLRLSMQGNQYAKGFHRVISAEESARRVATRKARGNYRKKGYKLTETHKRRIGLSHQGLRHTVATRTKLSGIAKAREARKRTNC